MIEEMADAKFSNRSDNVSDGIYTVAIKKFFMVEEGYKGDSVGVEFFVAAAEVQTKREVLREGEDPNVVPKPNSVGSTMSCTWNMSDKQMKQIGIYGLFAVNVKAMLAAVLGIDVPWGVIAFVAIAGV